MKKPSPNAKLITKLKYGFGLIGVGVELQERQLDQYEAVEFKSSVIVMPDGLDVYEAKPKVFKWRYGIVEPTGGDELGEWNDFGPMFSKLAELIVNSRLSQFDAHIGTIDDANYVPSVHGRLDPRRP